MDSHGRRCSAAFAFAPQKRRPRIGGQQKRPRRFRDRGFRMSFQSQRRAYLRPFRAAPRMSPRAGTRIGGAILLDRFLFFRNLARLDRQTQLPGLRRQCWSRERPSWSPTWNRSGRWSARSRAQVADRRMKDLAGCCTQPRSPPSSIAETVNRDDRPPLHIINGVGEGVVAQSLDRQRDALLSRHPLR